ncbi:MAG TPA: sigma-70 family RNA polymerase sigma factor [Cyclobacteriaceae bacterium]|jgi:RNA polymerase sigma-70 factor (ECF subfamily)|nr:sigma-70 family RNA polymerase sigma factor [Cyclobacteriaceae bacterium]
MTEEEIKREYELVDRAKRDPAAFGPLYEKYFDRIFNFIFTQTDDEDLTADLCSQTFLIALGHVHKYEFRGVPISAWFYKIATNELNKYFNKAKTRKVYSLDEVSLRNLFEREDEEYSEETVRQLIEFMKDLSAEMLEVLQLRFFEEKEFREIAFILDISESTAKMRTYRALDKLRERFNVNMKDGKA